MNEHLNITIKQWVELTPEELNEMNKSHAREWQTSSMVPEHHGQNTFFLLKNNDGTILAHGQLVPIDGVIFKGEVFNIYGIGGIIANKKGQGYGKQIMHAIKDYLKEQNMSGVGFIGLPDFYKKCGFLVDKEAINRFVHVVNTERIINTESDHVCYLDSIDRFMEKIINHPDYDVLLPRDPDW